MGDETIPGGGDPAATGGEGAPASTSSPGGPPAGDDGAGLVDLSQVAEDFDAAALADLEGSPPPPSGEEDTDGGKGKGKKGTPDPLQEFIDKNYQGDRNAFLHAQYASREEAKRLRQELDEIKQTTRTLQDRTEPPPDPVAAFKEARESSPEIRALDQETHAIDAQLKDCQGTGAQIAARAAQIGSELKVLESKLLKAEPDERSQYLVEKSELRQELRSLDQDWKLNEAEARRLGSEKRRVQRETIRAESAIQDEMASEIEEQKNREATRTMTKEAFNASIGVYFKDLDIDPASARGKFLLNTCRSQLREYLLTLGDGAGLDRQQIHGAVGQILSHAVEAFGISKKQQPRTLTTPRPVLVPRANVTPSRTSSSPSSQSSLDGVLDNPNLSPKQKADFVRKRAATVFQAGARAGGGRGPLA